MNFELSSEQKLIRDTARNFAKIELLPGVFERNENNCRKFTSIK